MPIKKDRYPLDWEDISKRIKERAGWVCEQCGVGQGATIMRSTVDGARYVVQCADGYWRTRDGEMKRAGELPMEYDNSKVVHVYLETHHIGVPKPDGSPGDAHDKMDCRDENLMCLCRRCHNLADMPIRIPAAKVTRINNKRRRHKEAGQLEFWE